MNPTKEGGPAAAAPPAETVGAGIDFSDPNSPLAPLYLRTSGVVACGVLALIFFVVCSIPLFHTDVWGHLKFGEWMTTHRGLPEHEPFCPWGDKNAPFVQFYGLSQLAFYTAYWLGAALAGGDDLSRLEGGVVFLRMEYAFLVVARFAVLLLAYRRMTRSTPLATTLTAVLFVLSLSSVGVMRPQLFGEFFFACLLFALSRPRLSWRAVAVLPVLFVLWVNCHGSFLVGMAVLGVVLAGRIVEVGRASPAGFQRGVCGDAQVRRLAVVLAACGAATCINPHGPMIYLDTLRMARHPAVAVIAEWRPLAEHPALAFAAGPFLLAILFVGVTLWLSPRVPSLTQVLLILLFGLGACIQQRVLIWLLMTIPWAAAPHWAAIFAPGAAGRKGGGSAPSLRKTIVAAALGFVAWMWSPAMAWAFAGKPPSLETSVSAGTPWQLARQLRAPTDPNAQWLPELAKTLADDYPDGRFTGAVFSSETLGDYLTWSLAPAIPVTTYSHLHLFPATYWDDNTAVYMGLPGWWDVMRSRHANLVVLEAEIYPQLCQQLRDDPGWRVLHDERGDARNFSPYCRLFIAVRKKPA